jgi:hypothetical protein
MEHGYGVADDLHRQASRSLIDDDTVLVRRDRAWVSSPYVQGPVQGGEGLP